MSKDKLDELLILQKIEEKIFKIKSMYHPNLIANLSIKAYDLYLIRNSISNQLLEELKKENRNFQMIKNFITKKISEIEMKLKNTTNISERSFLKLNLEEWKAFL
ncbi:MAG: hypothetical protein P8Y23_13195 [Candidatus Lokiarchaeota archaeon]|jgi:hypothetical protein